MATEFVDMLRPRDFSRETSTGEDMSLSQTLSGDVRGLALPKLANQGYTTISNVPASLTMGTGLTFSTILVDDGASAADLGKVVRLGITVKRLVSGADTGDVDTAAATETAVDVTLDATSGECVVTATAIAAAALDSLAVGESFFLRVRRIGSHANDTCNGRVILVGVVVKNT